MTLSCTPEEARNQFEQALAEAYTVKMIVFGSGPIRDDIFRQAQTRAAVNPARRAVRVSNLAILTETEIRRYHQNNPDTAVCVLNLDGEPVCFLSQAQATGTLYLERSFNEAQQHSGNGGSQ